MNYEITIAREELVMTMQLLVAQCGSSKYEDLEMHLNHKLYGCRSSFSAFHLTLKFNTLNDMVESAIVLRKYNLLN